MKKRLIALSAGALATALFAAGCGGGSDNETSTVSIARAEFIKKADAICTKGDKEVEAKFGRYLKKNGIDQKESQAETDARAAEIVETILLPSTRREVDQIRALGAPPGEEDQVEAMLEALEGAIEKSEEDPAFALSSNVELFAQAKRLAERFGLEVCGF